MGEDSTDDLQEQEEFDEQEDSDSDSDSDSDELQGLEDALAEEYAAEDGGTGLSFYNESGYDYDASSPLTDVDYQSGADESSQFTSNGTGSEAYDPVSRDNDEINPDDFQPMIDEYNNWGRTHGDYNNAKDDNFDGNEGFDDDNEVEDEDDDDDDEEYEDDDDEQAVGVTQNQAGKKDEYDGAIKWRPGQPITVKLLDQVWGKCRKLKKVRPMVETFNKTIESEINLMGPNLMLRLNNYIEKTGDDELDTVGCLLKLAKSNGRRLTFTALSAVEALFDQQWTQVALLASLNEATLQAILMIPQVKAVATSILTIAVPMINKESKKDRSTVDRIHDARMAKYDARR